MTTRAHTRAGRKTRLGIVVGSESWHFFDDDCEYLRRHFQLSVFRPAGGFNLRLDQYNASLIHQLRTFLDRQQVAFFEWSSQLLGLATQLETKSKIATRLHRYELFSWAEKVDWGRVDAAIFVNSALLEKFQGRSKVLPRRMVVIPPGVSTSRFCPAGLGLTNRIGTLCWLTPRKRVYELILCFSQLSRRLPHLRLSIAGGQHRSFPDYYDSLLTLVEKLGLSDRVEFFGEPTDVPAWYRNIDVFVSNSYSEGLQLSLLEAMASARHCLSHAWQGVEHVLPEAHIYYTDRQLQQAILAFYAAPRHERNRMQMSMRREAQRVFDSKLVRAQIRSFITEVAGG